MDQSEFPTNADLGCLNSFPKETVGYGEEEKLIATLNGLCKQFGYGRVEQLTKSIWAIWYDPKQVEYYEAARKRRVADLAEYWNTSKE